MGAIDAADPDERLLPRDARHRTLDERLDEQEQRGAEADPSAKIPIIVAARLLRLLDAAEGAQRSLARLFARHASGDIRRHAPVDVIVDRVVEFLLDAGAPEH